MALFGFLGGKNQLTDDQIKAAMERGQALARQGSLRPALRQYERVVKSGGNSAELWTNKSACHLELSEFDKALEAAEKAIAKSPDRFEGWFNKARALGGLGDHKIELEAYRRAIVHQDSEGVGDDARFLLWANFGATLRQLEEFAEGAEAYSRALEYTPDDSNSLYGRGWCLLMTANGQDDIRVAIDHFKRCQDETVKVVEQQTDEGLVVVVLINGQPHFKVTLK